MDSCDVTDGCVVAAHCPHNTHLVYLRYHIWKLHSRLQDSPWIPVWHVYWHRFVLDFGVYDVTDRRRTLDICDVTASCRSFLVASFSGNAQHKAVQPSLHVSFNPVNVLQGNNQLDHRCQQCSDDGKAVVLQVVRDIPNRKYSHDTQGPPGGRRQHSRPPVQQDVVVRRQVQVNVNHVRL